MRVPKTITLVVSVLFMCVAVCAQELAVKRDARAVSVLQKSFRVMGGVVPADSVAEGSVTLVEGTTTEVGTIRILTRGMDQTAENFQTDRSRRSTVLARNRARVGHGSDDKILSLDSSLIRRSPFFPMVLVAGALGNADTTVEYVGLETVDGSELHHLRIWQTFAKSPKLQRLAPFSKFDLYIEATTALVRKFSFSRGGSDLDPPKLREEVIYSSYQDVGGVLYPLSMEKLINGTSWATINIKSVRLNSGLSDSDFEVAQRRPQ